MRTSVFGAALLAATVLGALMNTASAAQVSNLICFVSYANPYQAVLNDPLGIGRASVMPRETAIPLVTEFSKIYVYPTLESTVTACQCLNNPAPANSLLERDQTLKNCPKPTRIDTH